jgi:hypothetical protein
MAVRSIAHADIMRGRTHKILVEDGGVEVVYLQNIKDGQVKVNEEIKETVYEVEDATEIINKHGRKTTIEFVYSELDTADIIALCAGDEITISTAAGGLNGTGKTLNMTGCDSVTAHIEDMKTKIVAVKTTASLTTLAYTITDNAA